MKAWKLFFLAILICLMVMTVMIACGDDDDDDTDSTGDDDSGPGCDVEDLCEQMIETGFGYDYDECLEWFANEGDGDCEDFDAFYECGCDCVGMGPANFEVCLGECNTNYCYTS